jgi:surface antigen
LVSPLRETLPAAARILLLVSIAPMLGACSFAIPSLTAQAPDETTGSVAPAPPVQKLFGELGPEEIRRSRAAIVVALDPQGNGARVKWDNPESGMSGQIAANGPPFVDSDEVCRKFTASLATHTRVKRVTGTACKFSADEWLVRELKPQKT